MCIQWMQYIFGSNLYSLHIFDSSLCGLTILTYYLCHLQFFGNFHRHLLILAISPTSATSAFCTYPYLMKPICWVDQKCYTYRKFSNKRASPNKGDPLFSEGYPNSKFHVLAISQPKMVRFSFCKKPLEAENVLYSTISLPTRPAPLLENLWYSALLVDLDSHCYLSSSLMRTEVAGEQLVSLSLLTCPEK